MAGHVFVIREAVDVDGDGGRVGTQVLLQFLTLVKEPQGGAGLVQGGQLVACAEVCLEVSDQSLGEVPASQVGV